jgi:predicted  nucleic acid-binding Zn-ribbon protein
MGLYHSSNTARIDEKIKQAELEKKNVVLMEEVGVLEEEAVRLKEQMVVLNKNLEMMKKTVEELERKRKVQKLVTYAHDAVRMYNMAG